MSFVDQVEIVVVGGGGGNGCSAMFQPPYHRHPLRTGGNGGDGGDVSLLADSQLATLLDFQFQHEFRAERGRHGSGNNKTGRCGASRIVRVPLGTVVYDAESGDLLRDLIEPGRRLVVAKGGAGGLGNANASRSTPGQPGTERRLRLELKLIADVGLIGFPNAGKSSLLARISTARPKIASYPFTTKNPVLGVVSLGIGRSFVACDIPGLIEGAHQGRGLGIQFLRHVERTRLLVHVIDMAGVDGRDPIEAHDHINAELAAYSPGLARRPQVIAANKMDLPAARATLPRFRAQRQGPLVAISCATGKGIPELLQVLWDRLQGLGPRTPSRISEAADSSVAGRPRGSDAP
ncbi:MAG: Obg family GTPase CgtA [Candidatus Omnitrophica bacterium]|nr:Obg family GTPase CgtA [Candidatus Omnitrophota bacterium]